MILKWLPNWEITLTEKADISKGVNDPVLAESLQVIRDQLGLEYSDLSITLNEEGFAVIRPKKK